MDHHPKDPQLRSINQSPTTASSFKFFAPVRAFVSRAASLSFELTALSSFHALSFPRLSALSLALLLVLPSCVQYKDLISFDNPNFLPDTITAITNQRELTIQPQDLLQVNVTSFSLEAVKPFNPQQGQQNQVGIGFNQGNQGLGNALYSPMDLFNGYVVDGNGNVDLPVIGAVKVLGKTTAQAQELIQAMVLPYVSDAVVDVRYLNIKVTLLGEVGRPGTYRLSNERNTLLDVLGAAGDLTQYSNRRNIRVIREEDGKRLICNISLNDPALFNSPCFYLRQNDVIYVDPLPTKVATVSDPVQRIIGYVTAGLSVISIIVALAVR